VNGQPLISVVMPVYNAELYVSEAIESILLQTYRNFELIIIDDGSTDSSVEIIWSFSDERIFLIESSEKKGVSARLNQGVLLARGDFIARMDADDISLPDRFQKQVDFLLAHPDIDIIGTQVKHIIDKSNKLFSPDLLPSEHNEIVIYMLFNCPFYHPTVMARTALLKENPYSDLKEAQDYLLWTQLLPKCKATNLNDVLLHYRIHGNNISSRFPYSQLKQLYSAQLERQKIGYTPIQLETHLWMSYGNPKLLSLQELLRVKKWLDYLLDLNRNESFFDQDIFEDWSAKIYLQCWLWKVKNPMDYLRFKGSPVFHKWTGWSMRWRLLRSFIYKWRNAKNA
jgi:glycosyltransferase involved in cell wall biosynthesis